MGAMAMSHSNLTQWIEQAEAREVCRGAAFLAGVEENQHLHLGSVIATISEWWRHNVTTEVLPLHFEP
jgi:hypothetical protein